MNIKILNLLKHGDQRGQLIAIENKKNIPFDVKRVYYIFDTQTGVRRGFHAHYNLKQLLVSINGSCCIHLDDGYEKKEILLDDPSKGLLIEGLIRREMYNFSSDAVLLVLASDFYDEKDYIRDYNSFLDVVRGDKHE